MPVSTRGKTALGRLLVTVWIAAWACGCAAVLPWQREPEEQAERSVASGGEKADSPSSSPDQAEPAPQKPKSPSQEKANALAQPGSPDHPQQLEQILDRLQQQGRLSARQREKLAQDLALVDRSAWPILIQYFLTSAQGEQQGVLPPGASKPPGQRPAELPSSWPGAAEAGKNKPAALPSSRAASSAAKPATPQLPPPGGQIPGRAASAAGSKQPPALSSPQGQAPLQPTSAGKAKPQRAEKTPPSAEQPPSPQQQLGRLIASLEQQTQGPARSLEELQRHVTLRMLYLLAGRREQALEPIPGIPAPQQQYWTNQLYALAVYLDGEAIAHSARRATEAKVHLDQAAYHLGTAGNLVVKNLAFCTAVRSFGVVREFDQKEFRPGQVVLLYAELENFSVEETPEGYRTTLRGSYHIYDARGNQVASEELPMVEDLCRNRRRDFFVSYRIQLPQRIYPGRHKLQLTLEDAKSQRMATATLEFSVAK